MRILSLSFVAVLAAAGCGEPSFSAHRRDNNPAELAAALAARAPSRAGPVNATGRPLVFIVTPKPEETLVAFDLQAGKPLWKVKAKISSRVAVGRDHVYHRTAGNVIVARSVRSGAVDETYELPRTSRMLGLSADSRGAYVVTYRDEGRRRVSTIRALRGGGIAWERTATGRLGAPAAARGVVYVPYLSQYLTLIDASSGRELARLRPGREQITYARALPEGVFYGHQGAYLLNQQSASGKRSEATYREAKLPGEFVRTFYSWDAYNEAQARYSAFDRNRLLWRCQVEGDNFSFRKALVLASYRFLFGFDPATGELLWAYRHRHGDVAAMEHLGTTVAFVAANGEVGVLDAATGARLWSGRARVRVKGATFDADGFAPPSGNAKPADPVAVTLRQIIWDPDRRFTAVKVFAVDVLARLPGTAVSRELLKVVTRKGIARPIYKRAADALVERKDRGIAGDLVTALKVRQDFAQGKHPEGLEVLARTVASVKSAEGMSLLLAHLLDPDTPLRAVRQIALAATHMKAREAVAPLRDFLTTYRADPAFSADPGPMTAVVEALLSVGGSKERQLLRFVADDPRTVEKLRAYIASALEQTRVTPRRAKASKGKGAK